MHRRPNQQAPTLSPYDPPPSNGPNSTAFPRATSPSGISLFLSKPAKWFSRTPAGSRIPSSGSAEPRSSTSSFGARKPKISHPTDPRPILPTLQSEPYLQSPVHGASRSVYDLSLARTQTAFDSPPHPLTSRSAGSPSKSRQLPSGLGDLRSLSRKPWSQSAEELGKFSVSAPSSPAAASFQDKISQYRGGSPTHSPSSSHSQQRHPFPTITTTPVVVSGSPPGSSSPGSHSPLASASPPASPASSLLHVRSHSFTPKLPSKLSASKLGPPSPVRKMSGASDKEYDPNAKEKAYTGRGAFPFTFGGKPANNSTTVYGNLPSAPGDVGLMPPPTIVEPSASEDPRDPGEKRSSQITFHSGFINRATDFSPPPAYNPGYAHNLASVAKGWKPFKVVLRGTKMQFYKPPSDRTAAVKELFPVGIVPLDQEEPEPAQADAKAQEGKVKEQLAPAARRKRAFWGRRTHPDLVLDAHGGVEKGTFEALVHEAVFATTFTSADLEEAAEAEVDVPASVQRPTAWQDFALAVLFALPPILGPARFEAEFVRCCTYLVGGAEADVRESQRDYVSWLAAEYLHYHSAPADAAAWEEFLAETVPDFTGGSSDARRGAIPPSVSVQAIYSRSPAEPAIDEHTFSPNLGTFSPRPEAERMASLQDALSGHAPVPINSPSPLRAAPDSRHRPSGSGSHSQTFWQAMDREGFTRDFLIRLDPQDIARSLFVFNRNMLEEAPERLTVQDCLTAADAHHAESTSTVGPQKSFLYPFLGSDHRPHWLTKLILLHILVPSSPGPSASRLSEDASSRTSRTYSRAESITAWARVGELCRITGDETSWRAVVAALCSRPVARLEKTWKRVEPGVISVVDGWIGRGPRPEGSVVEHTLTFWGGEMCDNMRIALDKATVNEEQEAYGLQHMTEAKNVFAEFRTAYSLCPRKVNQQPDNWNEDADSLLAVWLTLSAIGGGLGNVASQFVHVDQFMSLSLAAESRRKGFYEPHFWTRSSSSMGFTSLSLVPLLFPEPLPYVNLINRAELMRSRLESGPTKLNEEDVRLLRGVDRVESRKRHSFAASDSVEGRHGRDFGGTVVPLFDGELLLLVQPSAELSKSRPPSRAPSRPPSALFDGQSPEKSMSRVPSIRVRPGPSQGLDRKASLARRNSLPSISQRTSLIIPEHSADRPVRVVVQAGTLERLVDVLAHGLPGVSVSIADDNGEMPLKHGRTRDVKLDGAEFNTVWWGVFRSFLTPLVFFELLRKRYVSASRISQPSSADLVKLALIRREVLDVVMEWLQVGGGAQDILDDAALYHAVQAFLNSRTDHELPSFSDRSDARVSESRANLLAKQQAVAAVFAQQTMRPVLPTPLTRENAIGGTGAPNYGTNLPNFDRTTPEDLVSNLDTLAAAAFRNVTEEDLFITADLLEVQTADRMGWFLPRDASTTNDDVDIQTIYSHLKEVHPSPMISELAQDELYRLLPPAIRSGLRAYHVLRKWIVSKIVAPRIGLQTRQARLELLLRSIEICREKSVPDAPLESSSLLPTEQRTIRSFVESILTSATLSPESRSHQRAWYNVAVNRSVSCDSLAAYLAKLIHPPSSGIIHLTTDMGYTLERMLEILSLPDVLDSPEAGSLVNLDKRRHLYHLILDAVPSSDASRSRRRREVDARDFDRLNHLEHEVMKLQFDLRAIKDEAYREAIQAPTNTAVRRLPRPFQKDVAAQHEKNKRDRHLRDRLGKERKQEQHRNDKRDEYLSKAMHTRRPYTAAQRQHRTKKSGSSTFFQQLMRPISSAFALDNVEVSTEKRTAAELDFTPTGKPALVVNVVDAKVTPFINYDRSYTFQLDTEDGGHYLMQAATKQEMTKWTQTIDHVSRSAARRRLTYLGNSPKPQLADHIHDHAPTSIRDPTAVFGVDLEFLLKREAGCETVPPGAIPSIIERCLAEVEARGLTEVGIYRIAGATTEVSSLKDALNRGIWPITPTTDIYAICDLVKSWFRVLPECAFPAFSYFDIINAMKIEDFNTRMDRVRTIIHALPRHNFDLVKRVVEHLDKVTDYEEQNHMTADALAIVFSPNLLRAPNNDFLMIMANMQFTNRLVKGLVTHFHTVFDEVDHDADNDLEEDDEFDEPIPEEDEAELDSFFAS
ncbi:hypothetical protein FA95DRAFT_1606903 [Auriscalpium vulgare]|uniref:Uncharacterized protein n=1 Tax=Auriscalpium vulgare TaxID=40419 RepID=A0ACB8RRI8_9AGAM|nr:hypothetical protein FA95DRAFT_1606903 [Auriscalpium vulgare]